MTHTRALCTHTASVEEGVAARVDPELANTTLVEQTISDLCCSGCPSIPVRVGRWRVQRVGFVIALTCAHSTLNHMCTPQAITPPPHSTKNVYVCPSPLYELDQEDKGKQHRPGVEYVTADGGALKNGGDGVLWHRYRGDC